MRYIISDTHFGHENLIDYCDRPFANAGEMNDAMFDKWQATVGRSDTVIHLGDVTHHPEPRPADAWLNNLSGQVMLVRGNHDGDVTDNGPSHIVESATIRHGKYGFYLEHAPVNGVPGWQIHGHHHNNDPIEYPFINPEYQNVNVSVELIDYQPLEMEELVHHLSKKKKFRDIHHARKHSEVYPL